MSIPDFLCPRLVGKRFEDHSIPLELLVDLAALEPLIIEAAKWCYRQENPNRKRSPRGFTEGISLRLEGINPGSAIPRISLVLGMTGRLLAPQQSYFELARDFLIDAISEADRNGSPTDYLPPKCLAYFDRLGRGLLGDEAIEFSSPARDQPARLTRQARHRLLQAAQVSERSEELHLRGAIHEIDLSQQTFEILLADGSKVPGPIGKPHRESIMEALNGFEQGLKVQLDGIATFNRTDRLQRIDSIEHLTVLDPLDFRAQLDDLRILKDGWYDGKGLAPSAEGLNWLEVAFDANYPDVPSLPYVYPVAEGGVRLEWTFGSIEASIDIDLSNRKGYWHELDLQSDAESARSLTLDTAADWTWLADRIQTLTGAAS